jgi:hypothetical protein
MSAGSENDDSTWLTAPLEGEMVPPSHRVPSDQMEAEHIAQTSAEEAPQGPKPPDVLFCGVDAEIAALRGVDEELSLQLFLAEQQNSEQQALRNSIAARIHELRKETDDCRRRQEETRSTTLSMRQEMKEWNGASEVYFEWLARMNAADEARNKVSALQTEIDAVPSNILKAKHRAHDALSQLRRYLNRYIMSSACTQLGDFGAAEMRCSANMMLEVNIPSLIDGATKRERDLQEACNDADYRAEESIRLESSHKTIAEQCLTEAVDLDTIKNEQFQKLEEAFREEKAALIRVKSRLEAEAKEIEYHVKRGTNARGTTKMTSADIRLHDRVASQQDELKLQLQSFESLRNEKLQLEREAEASLHRLIKSREDQLRLKAHARSRLDEMKRFHEQLHEERADWMLAKKEMHELILQQQAKIRAATVEAALAANRE